MTPPLRTRPAGRPTRTTAHRAGWPAAACVLLALAGCGGAAPDVSAGTASAPSTAPSTPPSTAPPTAPATPGATSTATPSPAEPRTASATPSAASSARPPAATGSSAAAPAGAQACRVADLDGAAEAFAGQASSRSALVQLRNVSERPCSLGGTGSLELLDGQARPLPTRVVPTGRPGPTVLDPRFAVGTVLEWRVVPDDPAADPAIDCPSARYVRVQPEGLERPLTVELAVTACNAGGLGFPGWTLQVG